MYSTSAPQVAGGRNPGANRRRAGSGCRSWLLPLGTDRHAWRAIASSWEAFCAERFCTSVVGRRLRSECPEHTKAVRPKRWCHGGDSRSLRIPHLPVQNQYRTSTAPAQYQHSTSVALVTYYSTESVKHRTTRTLPEQCPYGTSAAPVQQHYRTLPIKQSNKVVQCHCGANAVPVHHHRSTSAGPVHCVMHQSRTNAVRVQYQCSSSAVPMQYPCISSRVSL